MGGRKYGMAYTLKTRFLQDGTRAAVCGLSLS